MLPFPPGPALISPIHLRAHAARFAASSPLARRRAKTTRADDPDDDGGDGGEQDDSPWWTRVDIFGLALPAPSRAGSVAVIPIQGVLTAGQHPVYRVLGYADSDEISAWVQAAAADPDISAILLKIDSPGGMVRGVPELAAQIDAATAAKPVLAHTSGMMDSGAYYAACMADAVYCTPSADVGCIGAYLVTEDWSQFYADMGIKLTMFKSGDLKGAGHPDFPLTKDQAEMFQNKIDQIGEQFRGAVKTKRTFVQDDSMRGQSFQGSEAAARGLCAGLRTFDQCLQMLSAAEPS